MSAISSDDRSRILVIDDNPSIHDDFRKVLAENPQSQDLEDLRAAIFGETHEKTSCKPRQFEIDSAHQGKDGFEKLKESLERGSPYIMAFVDMRMPPGWDGLETIEHLWSIDPELHIVICTAYADYSWSDVTRRLGSNDRWLVLKKPFDKAEVCQMATAIAEKRRLAEQLRAHLGDLEERVDQGTSALRDREQRMQAMFNTAPDGIITFDAQGVLETANTAASLLFGYGRNEVVDKQVAELLHDADPKSTGDIGELLRMDSTNTPIGREIESVRRDGSVFPAHWTIGYVSESDRPFYIAIVRDQTEHKLLQCELAQAQKLESVGQLAAGIAHEINTPMQYIGDNVRFLRDSFANLSEVIKAFDSLLEECKAKKLAPDQTTSADQATDSADVSYLVEEIPETIEQTLDGIERIATIVRAMKEFSYPGAEKKTLADIHESLRTTITVARNEWKYVAEVETNFEPNMPLVPCLVGELNQVFLNLIVNAAHAIEDANADQPEKKGTILIESRCEDGWAEIQISDTGTGISTENVGRVFDPFFTTKDVGKGTGQGLAIARSVVVDKHEGTIDLRTQMGKGTSFRIRLPLEHASVDSKSHPPREESHETHSVC
ncbi:Sensor protein FixL [Planctomycetes bacterium Pan216]|uniref:histidine kinase n=1 Tax=Kolteria novifilia TaxID=2527975 RepID=A0A518AYX1_9BACT|nr:Sensor protein FixL [Planctomycetes bacterium Pan216]